MAWCPVCKLEYVKGVSVCPDCKSVLVESLEQASDLNESDACASENGYENEDIYTDNAIKAQIEEELARMEMRERIQKIIDNPPYKPKDEQYADNKSGAYILLPFGVLGIAVLVLNLAGVITFPISGFSMKLVYAVMGFLFLIFIVSGIKALIKIKELKPLLSKEKEDIEKAVEFIRQKKIQGDYYIDQNAIEESYLVVSEKAVADLEEAFPDFEKGFAFYIVDRYASEVLDED